MQKADLKTCSNQRSADRPCGKADAVGGHGGDGHRKVGAHRANRVADNHSGQEGGVQNGCHETDGTGGGSGRKEGVDGPAQWHVGGEVCFRGVGGGCHTYDYACHHYHECGCHYPQRLPDDVRSVHAVRIPVSAGTPAKLVIPPWIPSALWTNNGGLPCFVLSEGIPVRGISYLCGECNWEAEHVEGVFSTGGARGRVR